jgi:hypothetical protein
LEYADADSLIFVKAVNDSMMLVPKARIEGGVDTTAAESAGIGFGIFAEEATDANEESEFAAAKLADVKLRKEI